MFGKGNKVVKWKLKQAAVQADGSFMMEENGRPVYLEMGRGLFKVGGEDADREGQTEWRETRVMHYTVRE